MDQVDLQNSGVLDWILNYATWTPESHMHHFIGTFSLQWSSWDLL